MKIIVVNLILSLVVVLLSCSDNERLKNNAVKENDKTKNANCIEIRDSAYGYFLSNSKNPSLDLNIALGLYDEAIQCDSSYYLAYYNKFSLLVLMDSLEGALLELDEIINVFNVKTYQIYKDKSTLYKRMSKIDSAKYYSKKAYDLLISNVRKYPDSIPILQDWILYTVTKEGKKKGIDLADSLVNVHPTSENLKLMHEMILEFDSLNYYETGLFY